MHNYLISDYICCGKKYEDCERARGGTNGIFDHNHNWDRNPSRCPMYMTQICDVDARWPEGDEELCINRFHRCRSLRLLRELYEELGEERIGALERHFNSVSSSGFTLDEILHEDLTLIQYSLNSQQRK